MMVFAVGFNAAVLNSPPDSARSVAVLRGPAGRWKSPPACLVISGDAARRQMIAAAAGLAGWSECLSPDNVPELQDASDQDISLAIIDLAAPVGERMHDTVELAEKLASHQHTLVVICGSVDCVDEELWARQLGVWLYLPGVTEGDSLTSLCIEARRLRADATRALRPPDIHREVRPGSVWVEVQATTGEVDGQS